MKIHEKYENSICGKMSFSTPCRRRTESSHTKIERWDENEKKNMFGRNFRFSIFDVEILKCYHKVHENHGKSMKIHENIVI